MVQGGVARVWAKVDTEGRSTDRSIVPPSRLDQHRYYCRCLVNNYRVVVVDLRFGRAPGGMGGKEHSNLECFSLSLSASLH